MGQIALAEQGTETIKLTDQDRKDLKSAKHHKALRTVFAAAATGLSATAAYYTNAALADPQAAADWISGGMEQTVSDIAPWAKAYLWIIAGLGSNLLLTPLWLNPQNKINEKLYNIWQRQNDSARAAEQEKLDRAEKKFMHSLADKSSEDLTQSDYDKIALVSDENKRLVTDAVQYRRILDTEDDLGGFTFAGYVADRHENTPSPTQRDLTNSLWILPAMLTFTAPLVGLVSALSAKIPSAQELEISEPDTPDLDRIKNDIVRNVQQEKLKAAASFTHS